MSKGEIILSKFDLDEAEKAIVNNLIENYKHKIGEKIDYEYIQLRLKKSQHGKAFLHELQGHLKTKEKIFVSSAADYNLFAAIAEVLEKLMHEAEHKERTSRQIR